MSWQLMVIGQLSIALLGSTAALGWYILKLRRANASLFEALEGHRGEDRPDDAAAAVNAEVTATAEVVEEPALEAPPEPAAVPATPAEPDAPDSAADVTMDSGLKVLLQQFTQDSRDMMGRIDELEAQTRALIAAAQAPSTPDADTAGDGEVQPMAEAEQAAEADSDTAATSASTG